MLSDAVQGLLEQVTTATVNLVNADLLAKNRGLTIIETTVPAPGKCAPHHERLNNHHAFRSAQ